MCPGCVKNTKSLRPDKNWICEIDFGSIDVCKPAWKLGTVIDSQH